MHIMSMYVLIKNVLGSKYNNRVYNGNINYAHVLHSNCICTLDVKCTIFKNRRNSNHSNYYCEFVKIEKLLEKVEDKF